MKKKAVMTENVQNWDPGLSGVNVLVVVEVALERKQENVLIKWNNFTMPLTTHVKVFLR